MISAKSRYGNISISRAFSPNIIAMALILICICLTILSVPKATTQLRGIDVPNHFLFSIEFYGEVMRLIHDEAQSLASKCVQGLMIVAMPTSTSSVYWPNGFNAVAAFFYSMFGSSIVSSRYAMIAFLVVLLMSVYGVGKRLYNSTVGVFAIVLTFLTPMIFESAIQPQLDLPLTAFVTLSLYLMLRSNHFTLHWTSFLFGIVLGMTAHIKGQSLIFLAFPIMIYVGEGLIEMWKKRADRNSVATFMYNVIMAFTVAALIAALWWLHQSKGIISSLSDHLFLERKGIDAYWGLNEKYSIACLSYYIRTLTEAFGPGLYGFFIFSFAGIVVKKKINRMLLWWTLVPLVIFSGIFTVKHTRFLMPIIPAAAICIAAFIFSLRTRWARYSLCVVVLLYGIIQCGVLSLGDGEMRDIKIRGINVFGITRYQVEPWLNEEIKAFDVVNDARKIAGNVGNLHIGIMDLEHEGARSLFYEANLKAVDWHVDTFDLGAALLTGVPERWFAENQFLVFIVPLRYAREWPSEESVRMYNRHFLNKSQNDQATVDLANLTGLMRINKERFEFVNAYDSKEGAQLLFAKKEGL